MGGACRDAGAADVFAHLELNHEHHGADNEHRIHAPPHARDVELKEDRTREPGKVFLEQTDLREPRFRLRGKYGEFAVGGQRADDGIGLGLKEFRN